MKEFIHWFSRHTPTRGESWKARAREREATVQARTVGIIDLGADGAVADKVQTYGPRLEGLAPWFLRNANCQDTYELLNKSRRPRLQAIGRAIFVLKKRRGLIYAQF